MACCVALEGQYHRPDKVSQKDNTMIEDIPLLIRKSFPDRAHSIRITEFLAYMASVNIGNTPGYKGLKRILVKGVQEAGFKPDSRILFRPPRSRRLNSLRKLVLLK
ncbi:hypothetical protein MTO96_024947 [Rhipicephalus appendiculatus]